jgi:hypothetical protein
MGNNFIYLNVKTVPAFDVVSLAPHTAYTVYTHLDGTIRLASAWTLRDAIDLYARLYGCERSSVKLVRPFRQQ